jgi:hypothetical protein
VYLKNNKKKKIWWLPNYYFTPSDKQPGEVNNYKYGEFSVAKCPECDGAWEYGVIGKKRIPIYHNEFPTYKLKNKVCPNCKNKESDDES